MYINYDDIRRFKKRPPRVNRGCSHSPGKVKLLNLECRQCCEKGPFRREVGVRGDLFSNKGQCVVVNGHRVG